MSLRPRRSVCIKVLGRRGRANEKRRFAQRWVQWTTTRPLTARGKACSRPSADNCTPGPRMLICEFCPDSHHRYRQLDCWICTLLHIRSWIYSARTSSSEGVEPSSAAADTSVISTIFVVGPATAQWLSPPTPAFEAGARLLDGWFIHPASRPKIERRIHCRASRPEVALIQGSKLLAGGKRVDATCVAWPFFSQ